jgi:cbb3-type cytochrome oxidase cytochrome c subunit
MPTYRPDETQDYPMTGEMTDRAAWQANALAAPAVPYTDQLACAKRELRMRRQAYPAWVQQGKMTQAWAALQVAHQEAIIATLERLVALYEPPAQEALPR